MAFSGTKDTTCFVCGADNPLGLHVPFEQDGESGSRATYIARKEHGGWNGILHGGVTFSLMDEAFGWCLFFQNIPSVTARITTRFHQPAHIGARLSIRAWIVKQRRNLFDAKAEVRLDTPQGELIAEADAVLYSIVATQGSNELMKAAEVIQ